MARYLLDTDAVIDYLGGIPASVSLVQELRSRDDLLCTCSVVIAEVFSGLHPQDRDKAQALLGACSFLPTSLQASRQAGEWRYLYARRGMTLYTADVLIAATAHIYGATIVTGNLNDYPMPEVSVLPLPRTAARQ